MASNRIKNRPEKTLADHERERRIIDAAYGLVLGAFDGLLGNEERANAEWKKQVVQAAAMEAALAFISEIEPSK